MNQKPFNPAKLDKLIAAVAEITGIDPAAIRSRTHRAEVNFARNVIYTVAVEDLGFANRPTARHIGRDNLCAARRRFHDRIKANPVEQALVLRVRRQLKAALKPAPRKHPLADRAKLIIADLTGVPVVIIESRARSDRIAFARQAAATITYEALVALGKWGAYSVTARAFNLDDGTVHHARRAVRDRCEVSLEARRLLARARALLIDQTFTHGDGI